MEEEEPGEDHSTLRGNSMIVLNLFEKGGHGTSLFLFFFGFLVYTATKPVWFRVT
jgi:hypothetical protein